MDDRTLIEKLDAILRNQGEMQLSVDHLSEKIDQMDTEMREFRKDLTARKEETLAMQAEVKYLRERFDRFEKETKTDITNGFEYARKLVTERKSECDSRHGEGCRQKHEGLFNNVKIWIGVGVISVLAYIVKTIVVK